MHNGEAFSSPLPEAEFREDREAEQPNTIRQVLEGFKRRLEAHIRELSSDFAEEGIILSDSFANEFMTLLRPGVDSLRLSGHQPIYVQEALLNAWKFKNYPRSSPTVDENSVLAVATYLNSLVQPEGR